MASTHIRSARPLDLDNLAVLEVQAGQMFHSVGMSEIADAVPDREGLRRSQGRGLIWVVLGSDQTVETFAVHGWFWLEAEFAHRRDRCAQCFGGRDEVAEDVDVVGCAGWGAPSGEAVRHYHLSADELPRPWGRFSARSRMTSQSPSRVPVSGGIVNEPTDSIALI